MAEIVGRASLGLFMGGFGVYYIRKYLKDRYGYQSFKHVIPRKREENAKEKAEIQRLRDENERLKNEL